MSQDKLEKDKPTQPAQPAQPSPPQPQGPPVTTQDENDPGVPVGPGKKP